MSENLFGRSGGGLLGAIPNSVKAAAMALLVQQLLKHSQAGGAQAGGMQGGPGAAPAGGGLGGLLGGLLGGGAGSPMAGGAAGGGLGGLLGGLLGGQGTPMSGGAGGGLGGLLGGLGGLLGGLRSQGLGRQVDSWMAPGPNEGISPQDLESSIDPQDLDEAARHAGTDRASVLDELSRLLPQFVDQATPQGSLPQHEGELGGGGLPGMMDRLLGSSGGQDPNGTALPHRA
ncbi:YidB family protein [Roseomonas populi]|uniref:YidB family protein n=1 Tax=Roseomonas populi TaxID=3121582 RepID=A0ABT1X4P7_9PROT|nr:YidB family protein [Roseomonas pecuniae]MCR0983090.1 YidB family protein [Roseomonas pecuniae]